MTQPPEGFTEYHQHTPPRPASALDLWLFAVWVSEVFHQFDRKLDILMAMVQVDQTALDALSSTLSDIATKLAAEIASLKTSLPDADLSGVEAQVSALEALEVPSG